VTLGSSVFSALIPTTARKSSCGILLTGADRRHALWGQGYNSALALELDTYPVMEAKEAEASTG
jgi:hypothetical protein